MLFVPAQVQGMDSDFGLVGDGGVDILGSGIFQTQGSAFRFPSMQDTNIGDVKVGNDMASAFGSIWVNGRKPIATNRLEIKKNQDSGNCSPCGIGIANCSPGLCVNVNIDNIVVGNRKAVAHGSASSLNRIKVVSNQQ